MSQEDIDATKAPLMDHLIELRARIIRSLYAFLAAFIVCFYFSRTIYNVLTTHTCGWWVRKRRR